MFAFLRPLLLHWVGRFSDDRGQDLVEYALIAGMIALAAVAGMRICASNISSSFVYLATTFRADI